jgi:haloalkane dehalogenase
MRALPAPWPDAAMWPHVPRSFDTGEGHVAVYEHGRADAPPVLFVHGTPTWSIDWRHAWSELGDAARCIAIDHLGFGQSERPASAGYAPPDHARRFARFADASDLRDLTLVVHDFGGTFALGWAAQNAHRLRHLVVLNTFAGPMTDRFARGAAAVLASPLGRWLYRYANLSLRVIAPSAWADRSKLTPELAAQHAQPFVDPDARERVLWPLARALRDGDADFTQIADAMPALAQVPTTILWGARDPAFPVPILDRWRTLAPHARVVVAPNAGHWPQEEDPSLFVEVLRGALAPA